MWRGTAARVVVSRWQSLARLRAPERVAIEEQVAPGNIGAPEKNVRAGS
jgi:hypothetical protein